MGKVSFGGVVKQVSLAYTPEAQVGDYVYVHVGFALSTVDEAEAAHVFAYLDEMGELAELDAVGGGLEGIEDAALEMASLAPGETFEVIDFRHAKEVMA
jgi:hydrogenase expression/formation protein HypC